MLDTFQSEVTAEEAVTTLQGVSGRFIVQEQDERGRAVGKRKSLGLVIETNGQQVIAIKPSNKKHKLQLTRLDGPLENAINGEWKHEQQQQRHQAAQQSAQSQTQPQYAGTVGSSGYSNQGR